MATRPQKYPKWATAGLITEPTDAKKLVGSLAGEKPPAQYENWWKNLADQWVEYFDSVIALGLLGDGSDGSATLDGVATVPWASLSGSTYTLTREPQLVNLTINNGIKIKVNGTSGAFAILGQGVLNLSLGGTIDGDGSVTAGGTMWNGAAGGAQVGAGNAGNPGTSVTDGYGGAGGAGGTTGALTGGAGGTVTAPIAAHGQRGSSPRVGYLLGNNGSNVAEVKMLTGGGGGGSGGLGATANPSAAGGVGGSYLGIRFAQITLGAQPTTNIHAKGLAGAVGNDPGVNAQAGGGGGGGGALDIFSLTCDVVFTTSSVTGGAGGAAVNGGNPGAAGATGTVRQITASGVTGIAPPATHANENGVITLTGVEASVAATFAVPFSNTPGNAGGYRYGYAIARTDGTLAVPAILITVTATDHITFTILDQFAGTIAWFAIPT